MTQQEQPQVTAAHDPWGEQDVSSGKGARDENFPVASLLLDRTVRPHVQAYYAFARTIDDIADSPALDPQEKRRRLDAMEGLLTGALSPPPHTQRADILSAIRLRDSFARTGVPTDTATDLLVAFRQDAVMKRYPSYAALEEYCRYSANPVGRFLLLLHKEEEETIPLSDALCTALQILNHLQDAAKDLQNLDRCYLPQDMLDEAGAKVEDLQRDHLTTELRTVFDALLDRVDSLNRIAGALPVFIKDRRMRLEAATIVNLSCRLAQHLRRQDPLAGRVRLSKTDAILCTTRALRYIFRP